VADLSDPLAAFINAACVPLDSGHTSGTLDTANEILAARPDLASASVHVAATLGDDTAVTRLLHVDPANATIKGGPRGWDALTHLCFSRYLRLDGARSDGFVRAAKALLDAGASANTGWFEVHHQPEPEWESAIYGAAGVAHHAGLTRLLVEYGADPNDEETPYHTPETFDNGALKALVESGKLTDDSLATMLLRKADWHDCEGLTFLLDHGADPNRMTRWHHTALHHAIRRDNALKNIEALLDHGADPMLRNRADGRSAIEMAARRGRGDVLESVDRRGFSNELQGGDRLIAACARNDIPSVRVIATQEPQAVGQLLEAGGTLLAEFAGVGNTNGVRNLLDLGVNITSLYKEGDGYFGTARDSMAIHVAAWRANHATLKLLIERGSPVDVVDGKGNTPLALAVRACVDSYWSDRRSPESVDALLQAGASVEGIHLPTGYHEVDELIRAGSGLPL
jgi:ankyrin repeat protein